MSAADKNIENKVIENMTFIKQGISEFYSKDKAETDQEIKKLLNIFENLENKNVEKLEYLIKQVANFINKFENLENETILEQFEKILYSINNSRLELLEEIAKLSSGNITFNDTPVNNLVNNIEPQNKENISEETVNNFLSELLLFKKANHSTLSKVYFNLKKQIDDLKISLEQNNSDNSNNTDLNILLTELSEFKKNNNSNLKTIYRNLNKKIGELNTNTEKTNISDTEISIKKLNDEIIKLRNETASNSKKITILLETFNILNININKIGQLIEKNLSEKKEINP